MNRADIVKLVIEIVKDYLMSVDGSKSNHVGENTRLLGTGGILDSLGLVTVILDLEEQINDCLRIPITIADDRAMAQSRSPFRTIASLADYALVLIGEESRA